MNTLNSRSFNDSVPIAPQEIRLADNGVGERHVLNDNGGLSSFHHFEENEEGGSQGKLIGGALVVALLLGAVGIYAYTGSGSNTAGMAQKASVTSMASNIPATAPIQTTPMTPPAVTPAPDAATSAPTGSPYDAAPAAAPPSDTARAIPDVTSDKPVKYVRAPLVKQKDDAAQNTAEAGKTVQLNRDSSAADRVTQNGSVAVPLPATPSSSVASKAPTSEADSAVQEVPAPAVTPEQQPAASPAAPAPQAEQPPAPQPQ
jgi:hypothetical protein